MGNFIWPLIDGKRNLIEISELVHEEFGDKAEPLYNRLVQYIKTLEAYGFITVNPGAEASESKQFYKGENISGLQIVFSLFVIFRAIAQIEKFMFS